MKSRYVIVMMLALSGGCGGNEEKTSNDVGDVGAPNTSVGEGHGLPDDEDPDVVTMELPAPASDCAAFAGRTCLHFTGVVDGAPIAGTCDTIGSGVSGSGSMHCNAEVEGDAEPLFEFNISLHERLEPPPGEFELTLGPDATNVISFTYAPTQFVTNQGGYQLADTHEISGQLVGTQALDENSSSPRRNVIGQARVRWTPRTNCAQNCQDVSLRIEFGFSHPYSG